MSDRRDWTARLGPHSDRRLAVNAALREAMQDVHDELDRLDGRLGILRCLKTRKIFGRAFVLLEARCRKSNETEKEAGRLLAYDSVELERRYT